MRESEREWAGGVQAGRAAMLVLPPIHALVLGARRLPRRSFW